MLAHLRRRVTELLRPPQPATLSSCGRAGVQAQRLLCEGRGLRLYVLVPPTSDHLFNLEQEAEVVVTAQQWQLRGVAHPLAPESIPTELLIAHSPQSVVLEVVGHRLQIGQADGYGFSETIDIDENDGVSWA